MSSILAFHGSPGTANDFNELSSAFKEHQLQRVVRVGYPRDGYQEGMDTAFEENLPEASVYLGYSWGAECCLRAASRATHEVTHIILIAPFVHPKPAGMVKKLLLGSEWMANKILASKAESIVSDFLVRTSSPLPVPDSYRESGRALVDVKVLRRSVLEKAEKKAPINQVLEQLEKRNVPVYILWAAQDAVGSEAEQVQPLRDALNVVEELRIENAGHALLWTHPQQLADTISNYISGDSTVKQGELQ